MRDNEPVACNDEGDVLYLTPAAGPAGGLLAGLPGPLSGLADAVAGAMNQVAAHAQQLENEEYKLTCVMPAKASQPSQAERRCSVLIVAVARIPEVLEMVKLELGMEGEKLVLEFGGQQLPGEASVHSL